MDKHEIVKLLQTGTYKVTFEKADGSHREMLCTLNSDLIPVQIAGTTKPNPNIVTVWDVEKEDWRAFRMDRLISGPTQAAYVTQ